jgi:hypothetical protein
MDREDSGSTSIGGCILSARARDQSAQDFPFRKIAHYLAGERYAYPRVITNQLYSAIVGGANADSVRALYRNLVARSKADPAAYSHSAATMGALMGRLESDGKSGMATVVKSLRDSSRPN